LVVQDYVIYPYPTMEEEPQNNFGIVLKFVSLQLVAEPAARVTAIVDAVV